MSNFTRGYRNNIDGLEYNPDPYEFIEPQYEEGRPPEEFRDKGYFERDQEQRPGPSADIPDFWDPDDDPNDLVKYMGTLGLGGKMGAKEARLRQKKQQAIQQVIDNAKREWHHVKHLDEPCLMQKFEFDTCLRAHRHNHLCATSRDNYERCKYELSLPRSAQNSIYQEVTGIGRVNTPPPARFDPAKWKKLRDEHAQGEIYDYRWEYEP